MDTSTQGILDFINTIVIDNHGTPVALDTVVSNIDIDSFGFTILLLEVEEEYCSLGKDTDAQLKKMTILELIRKVQECL